MRGFLRLLSFWAATAYAVCIVSSAPWAGPEQTACVPVEAFEQEQVKPLLAANIQILVLKEQFMVDKYLSVINALPPESDVKGERLYVGIAGRMAIIAIADGGMICRTIQITVADHERALNFAMQGA